MEADIEMVIRNRIRCFRTIGITGSQVVLMTAPSFADKGQHHIFDVQSI